MEYVVETTKIAWLTEISDWTAKKQDFFFFKIVLRPSFRAQLISILASRFPGAVHPCEEETPCKFAHVTRLLESKQAVKSI